MSRMALLFGGPADRWWARGRSPAPVSVPDVALMTRSDGDRGIDSAATSASAAPWLEELWDSHGVSVYSLAFALLGDEAAASRAVRLGLSDLASRPDRASTKDALRSWARQVYVRSRDLTDETPRTSPAGSTVSTLRQLARPQRTCLALCLFGGHTTRDVANLLGVAPKAVADLLRTGLREAEGLADAGTLSRA